MASWLLHYGIIDYGDDIESMRITCVTNCAKEARSTGTGVSVSPILTCATILTGVT